MESNRLRKVVSGTNKGVQKAKCKADYGLYIHVPFCKTRCIYCAFYSTTFTTIRDKYVDAVCKEIELRLPASQQPVTIYFGGGTPSQLSIEQLKQIMDAINLVKNREVEITIECNPDDMTDEYAQGLADIGFNRVSLGVQSFNDNYLKFLNRRHNSKKVFKAIEQIRNAGIDNISIDLMYGLPNQTLEHWQTDIDTAISLGVQHISCYCLTYEEDTPLYEKLMNGEVSEIDDELALQMYNSLIDKLTSAGFEHYEISNFALPCYRSQHNSSYWNGIPYIGIGAGAHSYDGKTRSWNICDAKQYIRTLSSDKKSPLKAISEGEILSEENLYNELIMTRLRTSDGLVLEEIPSKYRKHFEANSSQYYKSGMLAKQNGICRITRKGLFISDSILSTLFI